MAPRYVDIGDLQYAQHELFFKTRPVEQLAELEDNSPVSVAMYLGCRMGEIGYLNSGIGISGPGHQAGYGS
jgi:hypothetical protein